MEIIEKSLFVNIDDSLLFKNLNHTPVNAAQMFVFIDCHKGYQLLSNKKIMAVCKFYEMKGIQLEALFVLMRVVVEKYDSLVDKMCDFMTSAFLNFPNQIPEFTSLCSKRDFLKYLLKEITQEICCRDIPLTSIDDDDFKNIFNSVLLYAVRSSKHLDMTHSYEQNRDNILDIFCCIDEYREHFEKFVVDFRLELLKESSYFVNIGNQVLDLCLITDLIESESDGNFIFLMDFYKDHLEYLPNFICDTILSRYYKKTSYDLSSEDLSLSSEECDDGPSNFYFGNDHFNDSYGDRQDYNYQHLHNCTIDKINFNLGTINYKLLNNNSLGFLTDCFIERGLVNDSREFISIIRYTLSTEQNTVGFTNKYDTLTLFDHFALIAIANDVTTSLDVFLNSMEVNILPYNFPPEILMRVVSRLFDVVIVLYTDSLTRIIIDNALGHDSKTIEIYQSNTNFYYNIVPINDFSVISDNDLDKNSKYDERSTGKIIEL